MWMDLVDTMPVFRYWKVSCCTILTNPSDPEVTYLEILYYNFCLKFLEVFFFLNMWIYQVDTKPVVRY